MSKAVKWIIGAFAVLVGLLIIISLALPLLIDPNDYKSTIAQKIQEQTGRELSMPGDIKLNFSIFGLKTTFSLGDVALSSGPDFPDTEFFSSKLVEINLALWPLISSKKLQINNIQLEGVNLNLVRNEDGTSNWEIPTAGGDTATAEKPAPQSEQPTKAEKKEGKGLAAIDIGAITIKDINLSLEDREAGRTVKLSNFNLDVGHVREGKIFPLKTTFELYLDDGKQAPLSAQVDIKTNLTLFLARQNFIVDGFSFKGTLKGGPLPVPELTMEVAADIDLDLPGEKVNIKNLAIKQGEMEIKTILSMAGFKAPQITGSITVPKFSPRAQAEGFGIFLPLEDQSSMSSMSAEIDFAYDPSSMTFSKLQFSLDDMTVNGTAEATQLKSNPAYNLVLHIDQFDLDRYKMKKAPPSAGDEPAPKAPKPESKPAVQGTEAQNQPIIPVNLLRKLTFNANITVGKLRAAKLNITNIELNATGKDGLIQLKPFGADLYQGTLKVNGDIDARPDIPTMELTKVLRGVELGPMFTDLTGTPEIKGKANINVDITTRGLTTKELKANANGTMNLDLADCEIAKLKIIDTVRAAKALLSATQDTKQQDDKQKKEKNSQAAPGRSTSFAGLTATGKITNGVFVNNDLLADSELMKVKGKGTVDLNTERIDYLLTIYLAKYLEKNEETGLVDLSDTPIPYRIKGTFSKIEQSAALDELFKEEAKKALFNELEKQLGGDAPQDGTKKKSSNSTDDLINKGLKSLFGN